MNLDLELNNNQIINEQKNFLNTSFGKVVNAGIDIGLKYLLPDFLEEQIIDIKDTILENGFKEGLKKGIDSAIDLGKSALGIFTGEFENVSQIQTAVKEGGIIDTVSILLDKAINLSEDKNLIDKNVCNLIKAGKNTILEQVSKNIEEELTSQIKSIEKLNKYCSNWNEYYMNQDFNGMEKEYKKIEKQLKNIVPIQNTINRIKVVENLHNLIKNNGKNFNLSQDEIELANRL